MGFFKNLKQGLSGSLDALTTGAGPSEEALASLTPEQRAAYDAQMERVAEAEAQVRGNHVRLQTEHAQRFADRPLQGPAGEHLFGPALYPGGDPAELSGMTPAEQIEHSLQVSQAQFAELLQNPFGRKKEPKADGAVTPPDPRPPAEIAAGELAARTSARAPYLAPQRGPVTISRIPTDRKRQADEVAAWLAGTGLAGRPDLVYGVYRIPDHVGSGRMVEWEVVHAATTALPAAPTPDSTWFDGEEHWVARGIGAPSVVDEELVTHWFANAGIGPDQSLGMARELAIDQHGGDEGSSMVVWSHVTGVRAFHAAGADAGTQALAGLRSARPVALPVGPPEGVHLEVLDLTAISKAVQPRRHHPPEVPSPFPYLPSSPQEVLAAYLEVVGLNPADSYGVQITHDKGHDIMGHSSAGFGGVSTNRGPAQPSADGKARPRLVGPGCVVLAYRDRPDYAAGRERFVAYMREAWQGDLRNGTGIHRPVADPDDGLSRGMARLARFAEKVDRVVGQDGWEPNDNPHRYCWPPVRA